MDSSSSSVRFGQGVATGPVHLGGGGGAAAATAAHQVMQAGTGMTFPTGMSSLLLGTGGGYLSSPPGYGTLPANAVHAAWNGGAAVARGQQQHQPRAVVRLPTLRGPWTEEEDETLREMVNVYGERKWAAVAQHLPGRIGKQCRERWTNHLRPDIDKTKIIWTEQDDILLIKFHKIHGNRWSMIARELIGRSENAVKNHWNATKRSLKAKRRLKKKKNAEAPPGQQWSILEQYIRSLPLAAVADDGAGGGAPQQEPSDDSPPSSYNTGGGGGAYYGGEVVSPPLDPTGAGFDPTALGMYLSAVSAAAGNNNNNSSSAAAAEEVNLGAMNPDLVPPSYLGLDLNSYYYYSGEPLEPAAAPPQMLMMMEQDQQEQASNYYDAGNSSSSNNLITYPFVDQMAWQQSSVHAADAYYANNDNANNAGHYPYYYYYGDAAGAGPSGGAAAAAVQDDVDVVQMASMEFQMNPSEDEVTLNLAGFM